MRGRIGRTCALALVAATAWTAAAEAKTYEVTKRSDPVPGSCTRSDCSLREAVLAANQRAGTDKIVLPKAKRYELTQPNEFPSGEDGAMSGDLDLTNHPLKLVHPGRGTAVIDANQIERVFEVFAGAPVRFKKLRITGGSDSSLGGGGGVRTDANAKFVRSAVTGNFSTDQGGGVDGDGAADLTFKRSRLQGNETDFTGGGLASSVDGKLVLARTKVMGNEAGAFGGGIQVISNRPSVIKESTIAGNSAVQSGGGMHVTENTNPGFLKVVDSTVADNRAGGDGGGISVSDQRVTLVNSTISSNRADGRGGGIYAMSDEETFEVSLNATTVVRNRAEADAIEGNPVLIAGGGLYRDSGLKPLLGEAFDVRNSLIALNTLGGGAGRNDCANSGTPPTSRGHNLISEDEHCEGFVKPSDLVRQNPKIGKLKKNGGPTKTVALKRGSPAIGKAHKPSAPNRDQRGLKRDNKPDIGAFERGA